jgi:UDP-N-acetylglucosamine 1-carboxyvinyltransferase
MDTFVVKGGTSLRGEIQVGGAKNVALKVLVAALLTDDEITIHNVPLLRDVFFMLDVIKSLGVNHTLHDHTLVMKNSGIVSSTVPLEVGARLRTSSMVLGPLLARLGEAKIPNPGGCRLGARPIDRHVEALKLMGAHVTYDSDDGYFYAKTAKLTGATIHFEKNTHTGTETIILAAVLASGTTVLQNAAEEVEIDELIVLLNSMGARIKRTKTREITIIGVESLHGTTYSIMPDRNEEITFAIASAITGGDVIVKHSQRHTLPAFLEKYQLAGGEYEAIDEMTTRYFIKGEIKPTDVVTTPYPGFMTDWQAPWAVLMTQAAGISTIHETVFESRFSYVGELKKMGAHIDFFHPVIENPEQFYNFNWSDRVDGYYQAIRIHGKSKLHNAILDINDLRAGATLILAALVADGESVIHGVEQVDRGYENIESRLQNLGATISRVKEEV